VFKVLTGKSLILEMMKTQTEILSKVNLLL